MKKMKKLIVQFTVGGRGSSRGNKYVQAVCPFPLLMEVDSSTKSDRRLDSFV